MNASTFKYKIQDAVYRNTSLRDCIDECKAVMNERCISECAHPRRLLVKSADTGEAHWTEVPCGKCYHCRETMQNEWVTRMWHETQVHKYVYFTTLSYHGYYAYEDVPDKLRDAFWHLDKLNKTENLVYSPCLVRLEHLQMFVRNLRNDLRASGRDSKIVYYACGEYGKTYGRPHFHLIIWSDTELALSDIEKAWSIRTGKKFMETSLIGNVRHDDLALNGTLCSAGAEVDGVNRSANYCFKYVAKYVGKDEAFCKDRIIFFLKQFRFIREFIDEYGIELVKRIFNERMWRKLSVATGFEYERHLYETWYNYFDVDFVEQYETYVKTECFKDFVQGFFKQSQRPKDRKSLGRIPTEQLSNRFFNSAIFKCLQPFTTCSRGKGIGSVYVERNFERMVAGNLSLDKAPFGSLVLPRFYLRKIAEFVCPFECKSVVGVGSSYCKGNRPQLVEDFNKLASYGVTDLLYQGSRLDSVKTFISYTDPFGCTSEELNELLRSEYSFRDPVTHCKLLFDLCENYIPLDDFNLSSLVPRVTFWKYNRSRRTYEHVKSMWFVEWWKQFCGNFLASYERAAEAIRTSTENYTDILEARKLLNECISNDKRYFSGVREPWEILRDELKAQQDAERVERDNKHYMYYNAKVF